MIELFLLFLIRLGEQVIIKRLDEGTATSFSVHQEKILFTLVVLDEQAVHFGFSEFLEFLVDDGVVDCCVPASSLVSISVNFVRADLSLRNLFWRG